MLKKKLEKIFFYDENDSPFLQSLIIIFIVLNYVTVVFFILFGDLQSIISATILALWPPLGILIFRLVRHSDFFERNYKWLYFTGVIFLATILETIIFFNGGGLGGNAKSLAHDLIVTLPVYFGIGLGAYVLNSKRKLNPGEFFIIGGLTGVLVESFIGGALGLMIFFFGGVVCMYGVVNATFSPQQQDNQKSLKTALIHIILGILLSVIFLLIFGIIGNVIYDNSGLDT